MSFYSELRRCLDKGFTLQFVDKRLNFKDRFSMEPPVYWKRVHKPKKDAFQTLWDGHHYEIHV